MRAPRPLQELALAVVVAGNWAVPNYSPMQIVGEETVKGAAIAANPIAKNIFDQFSIFRGTHVILPPVAFCIRPTRRKSDFSARH
jgi:hypothetical protein